jgi:hypothetical protein
MTDAIVLVLAADWPAMMRAIINSLVCFETLGGVDPRQTA